MTDDLKDFSHHSLEFTTVLLDGAAGMCEARLCAGQCLQGDLLES